MPGKSSAKTVNVKEAAIRAALALAAEKGWGDTGLGDIAAKAKVKLSDLHEYFDDRTDILIAYERQVDRMVLDAFSAPEQGLSPRDLLFDMLMERFDILNEERAGVIAIVKSVCLDPKQAVIGLPHLGRSMNWMLEAAGIDTTGLRGALKVAGLTGLYLKTLRVWASDDSADMGKTMAALDKYLGRAERLADSFGF